MISEILFFSFCLFVQKSLTKSDCLTIPLAGSKVVHLRQMIILFFFCTITKIRYSFKVGRKDLYSPCTPVLSPDHLALSPLDAPFGFIGSNSEISVVYSLSANPFTK